jgi:ABC-type uncharacterized transport system substrate-binding protein
MNPKLFLWLLTAILLVSVSPGQAQRPAKILLVGFLCGSSLSAISFVLMHSDRVCAILIRRKHNVRVEWRSTEGVDERLPNLANDLVRQKVDVIVACGTPAVEAAKATTKTIPIIMTTVSDPLEAAWWRVLRGPVGTSLASQISNRIWAASS